MKYLSFYHFSFIKKKFYISWNILKAAKIIVDTQFWHFIEWYFRKLLLITTYKQHSKITMYKLHGLNRLFIGINRPACEWEGETCESGEQLL